MGGSIEALKVTIVRGKDERDREHTYIFADGNRAFFRDLTNVENRILAVFPELTAGQLKYFWKDEQDDKIRILRKEDFYGHLKTMAALKRPYHIYVKS